MITPQEPETDLIDKFTEPSFWLVDKMWGAPLLIKLSNKLHFEKTSARRVELTIVDKSDTIIHTVPMEYKAEQLCATHDEIDLVFRFNGNDHLMFDQDHEDNGAPGNGGATTTGNRV